MTASRKGWADLTPLALQVITCSNSTAQAVNSTTRGAKVLHLSVETNDVRYRMDADPTITTGVLYQKDFDYWMLNYNGTSKLKFQRAAGGTAKISIQPYKYSADGD